MAYHSACPVNYDYDNCHLKDTYSNCESCTHYNEIDYGMWKWLNKDHCVRCGINEPFKGFVWCIECRPELKDCEE